MSANADLKFADALQAMLQEMKDSLPVAAPPLPPPSVSAVTVTRRTLGLGNFRAEEPRSGFTPVVLMGGRIDALLRFQLWDTQPDAVEAATLALAAKLMGRRDDLFTKGFLRFLLKNVAPSESTAPDVWRQSSEFQVLYEYQFADSDADSLIARIPIRLQEQFDESTQVTDEMTRWAQDVEVVALTVRGPSAVGILSVLDFVPLEPTGQITVLRTFAGAAGPPVDHATWPGFLAATIGPAPLERHARIVFASLNSFLNVFVAAGDPVVLGANSYTARKAVIAPAILLPGTADQFQIAFQNTAFDTPAIMYLRATRAG